jgi:hypothetical protein
MKPSDRQGWLGLAIIIGMVVVFGLISRFTGGSGLSCAVMVERWGGC